MSRAVLVDDVWKFFGDFPALREVTLTTDRGSCLALLGRNGAGKTTLLRILAGLSTPSRGKVEMLDCEARDHDARAKTGMIGHGIAVYDELSAIENLTLFAKLYGLPNPKQHADEWLVRTNLDRVANGLVREFSRGMRQRLAIARAFLHSPSILLLDEPFTSLDDKAIALLQALLKDALDHGASIVMSTHQIREALELATHVALLVRGRLAHFGPRPPEMLSDPGWLYRNYGEA
jgi:heme ABC exporter ATP-binding subunit CcmA